ncbi:MAG: hypothetical protein ACRKGH_09620 [Dehalogenimonas sp.]
MSRIAGLFVVFLAQRLQFERLLKWYWHQFICSAVQPAAHELWPEVPARRMWDDLLVAILFPFLFVPAAVYYGASKNHPPKTPQNHDCPEPLENNSEKECF